MYRCFQSQLKALALCVSVILPLGATAQENAATQQSAASQQNQSAQQPASNAAADAPAPAITQRPVDADSEHVGKIDFSKPRKSFPNLLAPYEGRTLRSPKLQNSPRIRQLIKDGKLTLSLNDAVALALENNLDLAIARYNLDIADTDILRTKAGASVRGVASGLVQGTPGGGIGGFGSGAPGAGAGGTTGGSGGAGSGAGGLVTSTIGAGAPVNSYDPQINTQFNIEHGVFPIANQVTTGVPALQQNTANGNASYQQAFPTGTSIDFGLQN